MRILCLGDVVGRSGRKAVLAHLPQLRAALKPDFVIINGENAAGGFGITEAIFEELRDAGADVITTGNHVWDQRETLVYIERQDRLLRPLNYPPGTPGRGAGVYPARNGANVLVINAMGRVFMGELDCPFQAIKRELAAARLGETVDAIVIDMHAEATSEKQAMGFIVDGRASLIFGTHTHVPTADHQILPGGTGYITDLGMCGDYDSVCGMDKEEPKSRFLTRVPTGRFAPAEGEATVCGIIVTVDDRSGLCTAIEPIRLGGRLAPHRPDGLTMPET